MLDANPNLFYSSIYGVVVVEREHFSFWTEFFRSTLMQARVLAWLKPFRVHIEDALISWATDSELQADDYAWVVRCVDALWLIPALEALQAEPGTPNAALADFYVQALGKGGETDFLAALREEYASQREHLDEEQGEDCFDYQFSCD